MPPVMNNLLTNSLKSKKRVAVAMSGGVDSSVAAALLVEQGYDVIGLTMQLYDHGLATSKSKTCCAGQDIHDARRVAQKLGIPHYVLDYEKRFEADVIVPFAEAYQKGETPIPCVLCNQTVKFRDLIAAAKDIGAEALATGHYIRRVDQERAIIMRRAIDLSKDQSYFLFATTKDQLEYLRFPIGELTKAETRRLAEKYDLSIASKPDSQDICFVPTGSYTDIIEKFVPSEPSKGRFKHIDGRDLGPHDGIGHYTVGQRRGLRLGGEETPIYVISISPEDSTVVVGPREALAKTEVSLRDLNWLSIEGGHLQTSQDILARVRNTHEPVPATLDFNMLEKSATVKFKEPLYGVSPGQACVIYDGDQILGGGWIKADQKTDFLPLNKRLEVGALPA